MSEIAYCRVPTISIHVSTQGSVDNPVIRETMDEVGGDIGSLVNNGWGDEALAIGPGKEEEGDPERSPLTRLGLPDFFGHAPLEGANDSGPLSVWIDSHLVTIPNLVCSRLDGGEVIGYGSEFGEGIKYFLF